MERVLISLPDELAYRMKTIIPSRQRSQVIAKLLEGEVKKREKKLYQCALEVEADKGLNKEMDDWKVTSTDGIENETW